VGVGVPGATTASSPEEGLAVPEDDTTPDPPLQILLKGDLETADPHDTAGTDLLGSGQFGGPVGEEELMTPLLPTSAVSFELFQIVIHFRNLVGGCMSRHTKKPPGSGGLRRWSCHHVT
jgi:hypothetical protein